MTLLCSHCDAGPAKVQGGVAKKEGSRVLLAVHVSNTPVTLLTAAVQEKYVLCFTHKSELRNRPRYQHGGLQS